MTEDAVSIRDPSEGHHPIVPAHRRHVTSRLVLWPYGDRPTAELRRRGDWPAIVRRPAGDGLVDVRPGGDDVAMTSNSPRRRPRRVSGGIAQLPWRAVTKPFRPVEILSADQVETIHLASLRILRKIGFEILGDSALELFAGAGAEVDRARRSVRLDDVLVEELVAKAPAEFRLERGRRPGSVRVGDGGLGR
jgi:Trimethylamine methyltransferase (MTTB)